MTVQNDKVCLNTRLKWYDQLNKTTNSIGQDIERHAYKT